MFKELIEAYREENQSSYNSGIIPILLVSLDENTSYSKAITRYISEMSECHSLINDKDILSYIKEHDIKLVILIKEREEQPFMIELGTLNNLSADYSTIKELEDALNEQGIKDIKINESFNGSDITQELYSKTSIDIIEIGITTKKDYDKLKRICDSLIAYIKQYTNYEVVR